MEATEYRIDLGDLFGGPLDLLLYLVRRHEVDVVELPLAEITRQFVEFLEVLQFLDLETVGEFLVTAGTLLEMKSRQVLPQPEEEAVEDDEPDATESTLIERLLEYRRYKEAAEALEHRAAAWQERYPRLSDDRPGGGRDHAADRIKEVELWDLVSALGRVLQHREVEREGRVKRDDTPLHVYVQRVGERVRHEGRCTFSSFFEGTNDRHRIVGVFLAILELVRHQAFRAEQPAGGEIWILPPLPTEAMEAAHPPAEASADEATEGGA